MDKLDIKTKQNLCIGLSTIGIIISVFIPFIGYLFLVPSLVLASKRENITLLHTFVFDIIAIVSLTIILIVTFINSIQVIS